MNQRFCTSSGKQSDSRSGTALKQEKLPTVYNEVLCLLWLLIAASVCGVLYNGK